MKKLELANLHCRFGKKFVLMDFVEEIVIPAFLDDSFRRTYGNSEFFFLDTKIILLNNDSDVPTLGVAGRFIQNTEFKREQIFDENTHQVIRKSGRLESAPSAIFLFIFNNHRLLYVKETKFAPTLATFAVTLNRYIENRRRDYIDELYAAQKRDREFNPSLKRLTKRSLNEKIPLASVNLVPLASADSFSKFVDIFRIINKVEVDFVTTNDERNPNSLYEQLRKQKSEFGSIQSKLVHTNPDGLKKNATKNELEPLVGVGNTRIKLTGTDKKGDKLQGNNDDFRLVIPINDLNPTLRTAAKYMYRIFEKHRKSGIIPEPNQIKNIDDKLRSIAARFLRRWNRNE